ncbi:6010_t:CDS:1, partial [Racocetra persica]
ESFEAWIDLIYGSENQDTSDNSSLSSDNKADIPSAGNRRQWQYVHRSAYHNKNYICHKKCKIKRRKASTDLEDSNTVEYLLPVDCSGFLEKARAAIFLSLDELWNISNIIDLKASILDPDLNYFHLPQFKNRKKLKHKSVMNYHCLKTQINVSSNVEAVKSL